MTKDARDTTVYQNYLLDLGTLTREYALEAKAMQRASRSDFDAGYMTGFHRFISLMQQQADAFGIPLVEIGLDGIDADRDLI